MKRLVNFDLLRVLAIFSVIVIHVVASGIYENSVKSDEWMFYNIVDTFSRYCVPVLIMISGMLFLNSEKPPVISVIYKKNILRLVIPFIFWSAVYALYSILKFGLNPNLFINEFFLGPIHFWYLYMIIGIYMVYPFTYAITRDKNNVRYFLILQFIFVVIKGLIDVISMHLQYDISTLNAMTAILDVKMVLGYTGYFVLGYYVSITDFSKIIKVLVYLLAVIALVATAYFTYLESLKKGSFSSSLYEYNSIATYLYTVSVFLFFKDVVGKIIFNEKSSSIIIFMSKLSFGVYLVHFLIIYMIRNPISQRIDNYVLETVVICVSTFVIGYVVTYIMSKIPYVKRLVL